MATWSHSEKVVHHQEWRVPVGEKWGAPWQEVESAVAAAWAKYREFHGLSEDASVPGDFARFRCADDAIVISFSVGESNSD